MLKRYHQRVCALLCGALLTGCSTTPDLPAFTASGYLADRGVVRIWRKNGDHQSVHMRTVFTPFNGDAMETTDYSWLDNNLISVQRQVAGNQPDDVTLRFDQQGNLNFMQRQLAGRREAVSNDSVELYRFDAQRMLAQSNALLNGRVLLSQGHWLGDTQVRNCEGKVVNAPFDSNMLATLAQQQRSASSPLMVAWLEAPEGVQLLHITPTDECSWQPKESEF
ncbi:DUF1481 domain-containing protein [Pantoea sp. At-9b]|jgi:hypothetical protein|uniref:DUF1481 domain-containing protein n=1 Tax=Pantoea sp. (strain At-9b) TaxID=592316 RepID=UPI0001B3F5BB|nr:DUF1481 domain-containing protein [Pantoea sp. At-9b]ADU67548.1 protein of unknown function DUF1481 [Pantoea sp. At-9b]